MGSPDTRGRGATLTRAERRRQAQARRNRLILVVGVVVSVVIVAAWFPVSGLLHQRQQLAAASSELRQLNTQNQSLRHQAKQLETSAAVGRIAQQQYDLVAPGEQAYQVLPAASTGGSGTLATAPAGSGTAPGRAPAGAPSGAGGGTTPARSSTGFLGRVVQTLEFWR